ncbi:hypothetical protein DFH07DRAFT_979459 [Mycena maculata]|uniref:Uncharacterized protein n=1 Tax=Mycena maculata TaxID=230809 RepID=A0AAD7II54_9AGAR|nr:hypothetical protein DFH07DRAFT_979459 [Mycena maculata]
MNVSPMRLVHISTYAFTLIALSRFPGHALTHFVLEENTAWVARDRRECLPSNLDIEHLQYLNAGFMFLRFGLVRDDSPRWVAQSVNAGVLRVICQLVPLLEAKLHQFGRDCVQHILRDTMPKSLDEVNEDVVEVGVARSWLHDDWLSLMHIASLRSAVAKLPKAKGVAVTPCESMAVSSINISPRMNKLVSLVRQVRIEKRAAAMHRVFLRLLLLEEMLKGRLAQPPRNMQTKNETRSNTEEKRTMFSKTDVQFFRDLFSTDVNCHLVHLHTLAKRKFPAEKQGEHFALCLDYTDPASRGRAPSRTSAQQRVDCHGAPHTPSSRRREWILACNFMIRPNVWDEPGAPGLNWDGMKMCANEATAAGLLERLLGLDLD